MPNPRLTSLRNKVDNAKRWPHLMHLRLSACALHRMPEYFSSANRKATK